MIVLPLLDKYTTANYYLLENNTVVEFGVVNDKEDAIENTVELHLFCPMTTQEVYNYCNSRIPSKLRKKILLGVREYNENKDRIIPKISIWKLDWFCRNITERKIVNIILEGHSRIAIEPYNEKEVDKFIKTIKDLAE
jgi:hypothetical protein